MLHGAEQSVKRMQTRELGFPFAPAEFLRVLIGNNSFKLMKTFIFYDLALFDSNYVLDVYQTSLPFCLIIDK